MSNSEPEESKTRDEPCCQRQVLEWAMCQPGVLLLSSLAVRTMLACTQEMNQQALAEPSPGIEEEIIGGDLNRFP